MTLLYLKKSLHYILKQNVVTVCSKFKSCLLVAKEKTTPRFFPGIVAEQNALVVIG